MNTGVSCSRNLWVAFLGLSFHHCCSSCNIEEWSGCRHALPAKKAPYLGCKLTWIKCVFYVFHTCSIKTTRTILWLNPKIVNISFVGSFLLRVIHKRKQDLKRIFLCHSIELNWFLALLFLITFQAEEQLKLPWLLCFHNSWLGSCFCG